MPWIPSPTMVQSIQVEREHVSTIFDVEKIDKTLFRSKSLWRPRATPRVYGGQVLAQALVCATKCVDPKYSLHVRNHPSSSVILATADNDRMCMFPKSSHVRRVAFIPPQQRLTRQIKCYFLGSGLPDIPIIYHVELLSAGRSYASINIKAIQNGQTICVMICSFQVPEPWQPTRQWPFPKGVPSPEECELQEDLYNRLAETEEYIQKGVSKIFKDYANVRVYRLYSVFCRGLSLTWSDRHGLRARSP